MSKKKIPGVRMNQYLAPVGEGRLAVVIEMEGPSTAFYLPLDCGQYFRNALQLALAWAWFCLKRPFVSLLHWPRSRKRVRTVSGPLRSVPRDRQAHP